MSGILTWPGPHHWEAKQAYIRAREAGLSLARSWIVGGIASFQDAWIFRSKLAKFFRLSVRTVQRAITEAHAVGLIGKARAKQGEIPPGANTPIPCGWSHRWTIGWGKAADVARAEIEQTRVARAAKAAIKTTVTFVSKARRQDRPARRWTAEELDAELARLPRRKNE